MKKKGLEPSHDEHVNVTPLIDVVMCLIIFFLVCGQLAKDEASGDISLPGAKKAQELEEQRDRLVINLVLRKDAPADEEPTVLMKGSSMNLSQLSANLRLVSVKDQKVIVRASKWVPYRHMSRVLEACRTANVNTVHFATAQE